MHRTTGLATMAGRRTRRITAGAVLAGVMLAWLPRPVSAKATHDCPPPAAGVAAVAPAPDHCQHAPASACGGMPGCLITPPAMLAAASSVSLLAAHPAAPVAYDPALHGRLALGPPPPPPNS